MPLENFIAASNNAASTRELLAVWQAAMEAAGFDRLLFSPLADHDSSGRRSSHIVAVNFPDEWLARYYADGFEPMRQHLLTAKSAFSWDEFLKGKDPAAAPAHVFLQGDATGLYNGVGVPLRGPLGAVAGVTAAASVEGPSPSRDTLALAHLVCQQFYSVYLGLARKSGDGDIRLSNREREVLTWYSLGKTQGEIACILGLTSSSVTYYLKETFKKLGVHKDRLAVLKATSLGLIFPEYSDSE